jgi:hypothetical protein
MEEINKDKINAVAALNVINWNTLAPGNPN